MIEINNLTKRYGDFLAVDDISFNVEKGKILGFLGPNGAGKTTTMRIITGFMPPSEGNVTISGYDVLDEPLLTKNKIGYLPETPPLYLDMTVSEYLNFAFSSKILQSPKPSMKLSTLSYNCSFCISTVLRAAKEIRGLVIE